MIDATTGIRTLRNYGHQQQERQEHDHCDEQRQLLCQDAREVDVGSGHPGDMHGQAAALFCLGDDGVTWLLCVADDAGVNGGPLRTRRARSQTMRSLRGPSNLGAPVRSTRVPRPWRVSEHVASAASPGPMILWASQARRSPHSAPSTGCARSRAWIVRAWPSLPRFRARSVMRGRYWWALRPLTSRTALRRRRAR
jgi:hypothetical protein